MCDETDSQPQAKEFTPCSSQLNGLRVNSQSDVQHQYELMRMRSKTFTLQVDLLPLKLQLLYGLSISLQNIN